MVADATMPDVPAEVTGGGTRVVYVVGDVHSGSTLLSLLLASHPTIEGPGELAALCRAWRRGHFCTCVHRVSECPFWSVVVREWLRRSGLDSIDSYDELRERHESLRSLPILAVRRRRPWPALRVYLAATTGLIETIASHSGRPVVVDASKAPPRAYALTAAPALDVRLVHLVRDPRAVCFALTRGRGQDLAAGVGRATVPQPISRTAMRWIRQNVLAAWVRRRHDPRHSVMVRYEDLLADPRGTLGRIGDAIEVDLSEVGRSAEQDGAIRPRHVAAGNRMRMASEIRLRLDDEWSHAMSARDRRLAELLTGPWLRAYGYE